MVFVLPRGECLGIIYLSNATVNALGIFMLLAQCRFAMRMLSLVTLPVLDLAKALFKEFPSFEGANPCVSEAFPR